MADEQGAIPEGMVRSQAFWDAAQECLRVGEETEFATGVTEEYRNGYKGACKIMSATLQRMSRQVFHELPLHTQIKAADRLTDSGEGLAYWQGYDDGKRAALATPKSPVDAGAIEWEVWQDDMPVATSTSEADARHYLMVYGQDGPATLVRVERTEVARAALHDAAHLQQNGEGEGNG